MYLGGGSLTRGREGVVELPPPEPEAPWPPELLKLVRTTSLWPALAPLDPLSRG